MTPAWRGPAALLVLLAAGAAAQAPLITNVDGRRTTSLDGGWRVIVDPFDNGSYDYRLQPRADGYFRNAKPQSPSDLVEYDFDRSPTLTVPGDWNSQRADLFFYEGSIWYRRDLTYRERPGYPHDEAMLRAADEMGLLVWAEIPVYWTILWSDPRSFEAASRQLAEMVARDRNRASVILWSVANETPRGEARLAFLRRLVAQARRDDPTRLLTAATELTVERTGEGTTLVVDDPLAAELDVVGANEYIGFYRELAAGGGSGGGDR